MKVQDLMRTSVVTLHSGDTLNVADDIMKMGRIRHLPVVNSHNYVVGIVTQRDLYKAAISSVLGFMAKKENEWLGKIRVSDVMTKEVITTRADSSLVAAIDSLVTAKIGCLPVVDQEGKLVGLLTETDCLRSFHDLLKMGSFEQWLS